MSDNIPTHEEIMDQIDKSQLFIHLVDGSCLPGSDREKELQYAVDCKKEIVLWILPGRDNHPIPAPLKGYCYEAVIGDPQVMADFLRDRGVTVDKLIGQEYSDQGERRSNDECVLR